MTKNINISVVNRFEDGFNVHFCIGNDGVIRHLIPFSEKDDTMAVAILSKEGKLTDKQCQSALSLTMAARINYKIASEDVTCNNFSWDEIVRRG